MTSPVTDVAEIAAVAHRVEATIHQINGHWWNRRQRPAAPDLRILVDAVRRLP